MLKITALLENIFTQLKEMMKVLKEIRDLLNKMNEWKWQLREDDTDGEPWLEALPVLRKGSNHTEKE